MLYWEESFYELTKTMEWEKELDEFLSVKNNASPEAVIEYLKNFIRRQRADAKREERNECADLLEDVLRVYEYNDKRLSKLADRMRSRDVTE